ncbi:MAG TPA: hypothetical protein ACQGQW_07050, partial [Xylella fastidiosa subsp. pauca]
FDGCCCGGTLMSLCDVSVMLVRVICLRDWLLVFESGDNGSSSSVLVKRASFHSISLCFYMTSHFLWRC